jgi:hypothetical protein
MNTEKLKLVGTVDPCADGFVIGGLKPGTKIYIEEPVPKPVKLEINVDEAQTLLTLLQFVGGDPTATRRGHVLDIENKLYALGITKLDTHKFLDQARTYAGALYIGAPKP